MDEFESTARRLVIEVVCEEEFCGTCFFCEVSGLGENRKGTCRIFDSWLDPHGDENFYRCQECLEGDLGERG